MKNLMSTYRLKNLLSPRSVALVGASPRQGSVGRAILDNIRKGEIQAANSDWSIRAMPRSTASPPSRSLDKLPFAPELVVITAPAKRSRRPHR